MLDEIIETVNEIIELIEGAKIENGRETKFTFWTRSN
jgi:hypothetical protein